MKRAAPYASKVYLSCVQALTGSFDRAQTSPLAHTNQRRHMPIPLRMDIIIGAHDEDECVPECKTLDRGRWLGFPFAVIFVVITGRKSDSWH